jgi:hypothetical protein
VSLEMLGGERIPPPLPPSEKEREREREREAESKGRMGRFCRDRVGHRAQARNRGVGGTAPPRVAGAGGGGTRESERDRLLASSSCTKRALPGLKVF